MVKKCKLLILFVMIFLSCGICALAEERVVANLSESKDLRVVFEFDIEKPDIAFISPTNERIAEGDSRLEVFSGDKWCTYLIPNAQAGMWKIDYNKKSNTTVTYQVLDNIENIAIQYFKINSVTDTKASVSFAAKHPVGGWYQYKIFLVNTDNTNADEEYILKSGNGESGIDNTIELDLSSVSSGSDYKLALYVSMNGEELFDQVYSDAFSYTNPNSPEALSSFDVYLNSRNCTVRLDWSKADNKSGNSYYVKVTNANNETIYSNEIREETDSFVFVPEDGELKIVVRQKQGNLFSESNERIVPLDSQYGVSILTEEVTSSPLGQIECKNDGKANVHLAIGVDEESVRNAENPENVYNQNNDDITVIKDIEIEGEQTIDFNVIDDVNYVFVSMLASDGIYYEDSLNIYYDNTAPFIDLYEDVKEINVKADSFIIAGETISGATLKINGKEQEISENGEFSCKVDLNNGENKFTITSEDAAGNMAQRTVIINRIDGGIFNFSSTGFISLIVSLGVSAIMILVAVIFFKKGKEE